MQEKKIKARVTIADPMREKYWHFFPNQTSYYKLQNEENSA